MTFDLELVTLHSNLQSVVQRYSFECRRGETLASRMAAIEKEKTLLVRAVGTIDRAIQIISANGIGKIEGIVTGGMRLAFNDPTLGFAITKKEGKRGNTYEIEGIRGDVRGPFLETFGGGIWNVVGFLLRVIMIRRFNLAKVLIVDESFNNVAAVYQPMLSRLLRDLTRNHGYVIFAVTHQPILAAAADRIYQVVPHLGEPPTLKLLDEEDRRNLFPLLED